MNKDTLLDIVLLPRKLYKSLNDNKWTLYAGVLIVGLIDAAFSFSDRYKLLFVNRPYNIFIYNIIIACIYAIIVGTIDVFFFSKPLADLFKRFKQETQNQAVPNMLVKIMKVYITANILLAPVQAVYFYTSYMTLASNSILLACVTLFLDFIVLLWYSAVVARGINSLYNFNPVFKRLVFPVVLMWGYMLSLAIGMFDKWLSLLFK